MMCWGEGAAADPMYATYHDYEWGRAVTAEKAVFERICLEAFQVGLSWRTILHKREAFREVFAGFDIATVARYDEAVVDRLCADARIVRHRGKIQATINGARIVEEMHARSESLSEVLWSHAPARHRRPAAGNVAAQTAESEALAKDLRRRGFRFIGPVNMYAAMQACGVVNDHVVGCPVGDRLAVAISGHPVD